MCEAKEYKPGSFCWTELGTVDAGAAKKFYTELFGWSFTDSPLGEGQFYTMLQKSSSPSCLAGAPKFRICQPDHTRPL